MTSNQVTVSGSQVTAPSNGVFALFKVEARNTDVSTHEGPYVNPRNYTDLEDQEGEITSGVNDIRVYGSGEGGHVPETEAMESIHSYELSLLGNNLETYPNTESRPDIEPDSRVSGWVVGSIRSDQTPQLQITFNGTSTRWTAESADLSTPSPTPTPTEGSRVIPG